MRKRKVSLTFRKLLSEKLLDLGNLIAGAFVLGQFVNGKDFLLIVFFSGIILTVLCYTISYSLSR